MELPQTYERALRAAKRFLAQRKDALTASLCEDLAQESAIATCYRRRELRRPERLSSYVRTVTRRLRARTLDRRRGREWPDVQEVRDVVDTRVPEMFRIEDQWFEREEVFRALDRELDSIGGLNAVLVRGFYEGFSIRELAVRYELTEAVVKVRLHRSRQRIRRGLLRRLRARPR